MNSSAHIAQLFSVIVLLGACTAHADIIFSDIQPGDLFGPWKLGKRFRCRTWSLRKSLPRNGGDLLTSPTPSRHSARRDGVTEGWLTFAPPIKLSILCVVAPQNSAIECETGKNAMRP